MLTVVKIFAGVAFVLALAARAQQTQNTRCPPCDTRQCENETLLLQSCRGELVWDSCVCCKQCGRVFGEVCGGAFYSEGMCEYDLKCAANGTDIHNRIIDGSNINGLCTRKVCLKNCSNKAEDRPQPCGTDGRRYRNMCALRHAKHCLGTAVSSTNEDQICNRACQELEAPAHGNVTYSNGIAKNSVASFSCQPPYTLLGTQTKTCGSRSTWSGSQPECVDPCHGHTCTNLKECTLDSENQPQCVCKSMTQCTSENDPVCASNGRTYRSKCHMEATACQTCLDTPSHCAIADIYARSYGKCPTTEGKRRR